jgi:L-threonylcarbamoyladenylate synthase
METLKLTESEEDIQKAAEIIMKSGLVAFPTETVYGLGANAFDEKAVKKIYTAKGRKPDNPMIVHICRQEQLWEVAQNLPNEAYELADKFWPGPLTMVLEKNEMIPKDVTSGLNSVAVRMPSNPIANKLIELSMPLAAPSANISGKPSTTKSKHVLHDLDGKIEAIIESKGTNIGLESTVIDLTQKPFVLLRPGKISFEELERVLGKGMIVKNEGKTRLAKSPGMKYKHYSPKAKIWLCEKTKIEDFIKKNPENLKSIITISKKRFEEEYIRKNFVFDSKDELAKNLFDWFRKADSLGGSNIVVETVDEAGIGLAIMNRLKKAASKIV